MISARTNGAETLMEATHFLRRPRSVPDYEPVPRSSTKNRHRTSMGACNSSQLRSIRPRYGWHAPLCGKRASTRPIRRLTISCRCAEGRTVTVRRRSEFVSATAERMLDVTGRRWQTYRRIRWRKVRRLRCRIIDPAFFQIIRQPVEPLADRFGFTVVNHTILAGVIQQIANLLQLHPKMTCIRCRQATLIFVFSDLSRNPRNPICEPLHCGSGITVWTAPSPTDPSCLGQPESSAHQSWFRSYSRALG